MAGSQYSKTDEQQTQGIIFAIALGMSIAVVAALLAAARREQQKPKTVGERISRTFEDGRDATEAAVDDLRREVRHLRRDMEERMRQLQR
jgi:DNA-binding transcriptional MerR regulator